MGSNDRIEHVMERMTQARSARMRRVARESDEYNAKQRGLALGLAYQRLRREALAREELAARGKMRARKREKERRVREFEEGRRRRERTVRGDTKDMANVANKPSRSKSRAKSRAKSRGKSTTPTRRRENRSTKEELVQRRKGKSRSRSRKGARDEDGEKDHENDDYGDRRSNYNNDNRNGNSDDDNDYYDDHFEDDNDNDNFNRSIANSEGVADENRDTNANVDRNNEEGRPINPPLLIPASDTKDEGDGERNAKEENEQSARPLDQSRPGPVVVNVIGVDGKREEPIVSPSSSAVGSSASATPMSSTSSDLCELIVSTPKGAASPRIGRLLRNGHNPNERGNDGSVPFVTAARYGDDAALHVLANFDCDVNAKDPNGDAAVHAAVWSGLVGDRPGILADLVRVGCDFSAVDASSRTALHIAACLGLPNVCFFLAEAGVPIEARDAHRETALHLAARSGSVEALSALVECGAELGVRNSSGESVWDVEAVQGMMSSIGFPLEEFAAIIEDVGGDNSKGGNGNADDSGNESNNNNNNDDDDNDDSNRNNNNNNNNNNDNNNDNNNNITANKTEIDGGEDKQQRKMQGSAEKNANRENENEKEARKSDSTKKWEVTCDGSGAEGSFSFSKKEPAQVQDGESSPRSTSKSRSSINLSGTDEILDCIDRGRYSHLSSILRDGGSSAGANVISYDGRLPLVVAARRINILCVNSLLLRGGADPNLADAEKVTPLIAVVQGAGMDPSRDRDAASVIATLVNAGADATISVPNFGTALEYLIDRRFDLPLTKRALLSSEKVCHV